MRWWVRAPAIPLGTTSFWHIGRWPLSMTADEACSHMHILGKTGSGKSYLLAGLFLALHAAGMPVTLLDPHGDLAELLLAQLAARGTFADPRQFEQLVYLDIPAAAASNRFLPLNFLEQPFDDHAMAELVAEAARRAWPELAFGAPTFENILKHSVIALRQNRQPLTRLADLLTDRPYREELLTHVTDPQVVRFFHLRMDQWGRDEAHMKESTLNRADLLTLNPFLRHSLGTPDNSLNFREIIDAGRSVIINLALPHHDARRLLGCLLTVGMETAALSRAGTVGERRSHHLILDEFSQFMAQSDHALTRSRGAGQGQTSVARLSWADAPSTGTCTGSRPATRRRTSARTLRSHPRHGPPPALHPCGCRSVAPVSLPQLQVLSSLPTPPPSIVEHPPGWSPAPLAASGVFVGSSRSSLPPPWVYPNVPTMTERQ